MTLRTTTKTPAFHNRLLGIILVNPGLQPDGLADRMNPRDRKTIGSLSRALESAHNGGFIERRFLASFKGVPQIPGWHLTPRGVERFNLYGSD
jgi:hypothetical protein